MSKREKPELLSPAGNFDSLVAAVQNGADSVYIGGKRFNARINADNFDEKSMKDAIDYCHIRGVKVYAALNALVSDDDFQSALGYAKFLYLSGIDAVIVQDMGFAFAIRTLFPDLALHASTQMNLHNSLSAVFARDTGFRRIILPRELSLDAIRNIKRNAQIETECFAHGALCFSYSGQCLLSSMIFGRSGNMGLCAQPCRLPYSIRDQNGKETGSKYYI